jgi:hypothetical protein
VLPFPIQATGDASDFCEAWGEAEPVFDDFAQSYPTLVQNQSYTELIGDSTKLWLFTNVFQSWATTIGVGQQMTDAGTFTNDVMMAAQNNSVVPSTESDTYLNTSWPAIQAAADTACPA